MTTLFMNPITALSISRERRYSRRQILRRPVMYRWAPYAKTKILTGTAPLEEV